MFEQMKMNGILILRFIIFTALFIEHVRAKTRRFKLGRTNSTGTVSFNKLSTFFLATKGEESVVITEEALTGIGEDDFLEIFVEVKDRLLVGGSKPQPGIVLFFAPQDALIDDVSQSDQNFSLFEEYVVASLMDISYLNENSSSSFQSQISNNGHITNNSGTVRYDVMEDFSFVEGGFLKLNRRDGFMRAFTSLDKVTWNQIGYKQLLPPEFQYGPLKAGLRINRNGRWNHGISVDGKFRFDSFEEPVDGGDPDYVYNPENPYYNETDQATDEHLVWEVSFHVNNLCSDSADGLSTALKNDLEHAFLKFFDESYETNQDINFTSVMILGDEFEEGYSCEEFQTSIDTIEMSEDGFNETEVSRRRRKLPRTLLYSTIYFVLDGVCYGTGCPSDPSSTILTSNRRKLQGTDSTQTTTSGEQTINMKLLSTIQQVVPEVDQVEKGDVTRINCDQKRHCYNQDGRCCGHSDCFCPYNIIQICDGPEDCTTSNCCRNAYLPKCDYSMTCDHTVDMTMDNSAIVFGESHEQGEFPKFRVYELEEASNQWHQVGFHPPPPSPPDKNETDSRRLFSSSVSISRESTGITRVALGSNIGKEVKLFQLNGANVWDEIKRFDGPRSSLFGHSVSLHPATGRILAIGSPDFNSNNTHNSGAVFVYDQNPNGLWSQLGDTINGTKNNENFGWRVDVDTNNIVHGGSKRNAQVTSARWEGQGWEFFNTGSSLKFCFMKSTNDCEVFR